MEIANAKLGQVVTLVCSECKCEWEWLVSNPFVPATCMSAECLSGAQRRAGIYEAKQKFQHEDRLRILCRKLGIEAEYHNASLRDFNGDIANPWPLDFVRGRSWLLKGANGRGKTRLACAMLLHLVDIGATGRFTTANMYIKRVRASYSKASRESELDVLYEFLEPDVLVFDDLGAEKQGDFGLGEVLTLLSERSVRHKTNIVTTNLKLGAIHDAEPRLASRLAAYADVELTGEDKRVKG